MFTQNIADRVIQLMSLFHFTLGLMKTDCCADTGEKRKLDFSCFLVYSFKLLFNISIECIEIYRKYKIYFLIQFRP